MIDETPTPERDNSNERKSSSRSSVYYIVALVVLMCSGIYLIAANRSKSNENAMLSSSLNESNTRYTNLDKQYTAALSEVESYKGQNATLDSIINVKENQLSSMRGQLAKSKKDKLISEADYKKQLEQLSGITSDLTAQIETLQKEKSVLITKNDSLGKRVAEETILTQNLSATNTVLTKKVTIASLLIPKNIVVTGIKERSNGKETTTTRASKATSLRVCFDIDENKVADLGNKDFFARIIGPDGVTIAVQDAGSGVMKTVDDSTNQKAFTTKETINYEQKAQNVCLFWKQNTPFPSGKYGLELYQDGYFVAKSNFELK